MKKKITSIFILTSLVSLFFVNVVISEKSEITKNNTSLVRLGSIAMANTEGGSYTYFNPDIPYPADPCDTGGISVCYGN